MISTRKKLTDCKLTSINTSKENIFNKYYSLYLTFKSQGFVLGSLLLKMIESYKQTSLACPITLWSPKDYPYKRLCEECLSIVNTDDNKKLTSLIDIINNYNELPNYNKSVGNEDINKANDFVKLLAAFFIHEDKYRTAIIHSEIHLAMIANSKSIHEKSLLTVCDPSINDSKLRATVNDTFANLVYFSNYNDFIIKFPIQFTRHGILNNILHSFYAVKACIPYFINPARLTLVINYLLHALKSLLSFATTEYIGRESNHLSRVLKAINSFQLFSLMSDTQKNYFIEIFSLYLNYPMNSSQLMHSDTFQEIIPHMLEHLNHAQKKNWSKQVSFLPINKHYFCNEHMMEAPIREHNNQSSKSTTRPFFQDSLTDKQCFELAFILIDNSLRSDFIGADDKSKLTLLIKSLTANDLNTILESLYKTIASAQSSTFIYDFITILADKIKLQNVNDANITTSHLISIIQYLPTNFSNTHIEIENPHTECILNAITTIYPYLNNKQKNTYDELVLRILSALIINKDYYWHEKVITACKQSLSTMLSYSNNDKRSALIIKLENCINQSNIYCNEFLIESMNFIYKESAVKKILNDDPTLINIPMPISSLILKYYH